MLIIDPYKIDALVLIIGHNNPEFLLDTADSVRNYEKNIKYDIAFAIDNNKETYNYLVDKIDENHVYLTDKKNGWGRGILRTIVCAIDYFRPILGFRHLVTMDSDALCVGPFLNQMTSVVNARDVFFVGTIWRSPDHDHHYHFRLRASGFLMNYDFNLRLEMAAGPCMLWSNYCISFFRSCGLLPKTSFDKIYPNIHFAHDQISTYLNSCGCGNIRDVSNIMKLRWREPLPTHYVPSYGEMPIIEPGISIIHPTASDLYEEKICREYFKTIREAKPFVFSTLL